VNNQQVEAPLNYYRAKFLKLDPIHASKRTGISFDTRKNRFTLNVLGFDVFCQWPELNLEPADPERCPAILYSFLMQTLAARFLLEGVAVPAGSDFKAYRELPWGELYDANFQGRCLKRLTIAFGYRLDIFNKAAKSLGGVELGLGDASFDLPFFGGVVCRLILWAPDEEFPPSSQFLFSDNTRLAFNAEDLAAVGDVVISALKAMADIS